jgi:hypothetical protein
MKKPPLILRIALLGLALVGIGNWAVRAFGPGTAVAAAPAAAAPAHEVVVTYFTTDQRCPTCLKIEKLTREAVDGGFSAALASGELRFQTVNFDRPENQHFAKDYDMSFKTVVIAERRDGKEIRWEKFDEVWDFVDQPAAFHAYLRKGVQRFLNPVKPAPDA